MHYLPSVTAFNCSGIERIKLEKMGWHCSDTASLHFDNVKVPLENLIGMENAGFKAVMTNFNSERLMLAAQAVGFAQAAYSEVLLWVKQRTTFGRPLVSHQVVSHMLVDIATRIHAATAFLSSVANKLQYEDAVAPTSQMIAELCMLKNYCTETVEYVASKCVQLLGGMGYTEGTKCERIYRETKVLQIGGGSTEIMKNLAAKHLLSQ